MTFRAQIKEYARTRMHAQYGTFLLAFILTTMVVYFGIELLLSFIALPLVFISGFSVAFFNELTATVIVYLILFGVLFVLGIFASPFNVVGLNGAALCVSRNEKIKITDPLTNGFKKYLTKLGGMAWMYLFSFLWSCLFIIPGIVKAYSYRFTPYILAECPNVSARDALKISMRMTKGIKLELFVFDLSFIGWSLLTALTGGILGIYTVPYYQTAAAALYDSMKNNALASGRVSHEELL